ncbi:bifunctional diguanylate cyclase/phosphodiesterase [Phaeobacter sp. B1627]|uniref:putative bifunctional diguanylate cyclase/phosphodiesterase n=1 Tax=Phaeobacter sp. B1627 TaxID=2583809 RepID=UPI00111A7EF1|nr:EAL domain-containing protein [Phaeobacter sp. B1627]TNJ39342.1 EAL domain-containing protein [Phaeobacter sp. B1627]
MEKFGKTSDVEGLDPRILKVTTITALIAAVAVAVVVPILHFYFGYQFIKGGSIAEVEMNARAVTQIVGRNPTLWQFETLRISDILEGPNNEREGWKVIGAGGEVIAAVGREFTSRPIIRATAPIYDAGIEVARLEVVQSLRELLMRSFFVSMFSGSLGVVIFAAIRILPLGLLKRAIDRASYLASHDPLTKLPNRTLFNDRLMNAIAEAEHLECGLAVLCLDLDHFKDVNDILGHGAGDILLEKAAERMSGVLGRSDFLARLGGDEFAIIQWTADQPNGATDLANKLIAELARPFDLDGNETVIGTSVGITVYDRGMKGDGADAQRLLQQADLALYRAKNDCRGSLQFFAEEMNRKLLARKKLEHDLRRAIAEDELELNFQPQVDLTTNEVSGVEALLRWNHPTEGRISPDQFITLAEETGLIIPIGEYVIRKACYHSRDWPHLKFAVNVSPIQFRQGNLVETIRSALEAEEVAPGRLEIEITEGILLQNTDETISILNQIKSMGVRIAMDDFGTGYSSLSYLRRFDFDKIKIDRSFISGLGESRDADCIIQAVIDLGVSLGMKSNAEGVETVEQARILKARGCEEVQGFFFGKPMTSKGIQELVLDQEWMLVADSTKEKMSLGNKYNLNGREGSR